ncbi:MAG TPA: FAD-dependent oxidoreductase, partial [Planctomycetaceae bacterium]|nr:FAD-dependent oxidoreductase [Planctomycetaceae bacterium]
MLLLRAVLRTFLFTLPLLLAGTASAKTLTADVIVYGGTSAGVTAAIQCAKMGKSAILIEPGTHFGGLSSGGLGATDIGNKNAIGGLSREFYRRIKRWYDQPEAWRHEKRSNYKSARQHAGEDTMWTFEPHVAEAVFDTWLAEYPQRITVLKSAALVREQDALQRDSQSVQSIRLSTGVTVTGKVFIDCTYEGDLMALAGVSYTVGREANSRYEETLNGVQTRMATKHQLMPGIDPYITPGNAQSGLLPGIDPTGPGQEGAADHRVQAYCFRMCNTNHEANRIPFVKPAGYDERQFELLFRNFEAGATIAPWHAIAMPNRKTDTNNNRGFSTDYIGQSYNWAEASYAERESIFANHLQYQQGLMWTLANHPRVPAKIRDY